MVSPEGDELFKVPIPDPTTLTTDQLLREVVHLREFVELRIKIAASAHDVMNLRITGIDALTTERLDELRREAQDTAERVKEGHFLSRETFDAFSESYAVRHQDLVDRVTKASSELATLRLITMMALGFAVVGLLVFGLHALSP